MKKSKINASLSEVTLSAEPNKMLITGCVATIGKASTGSPCGADGKLVAFTKEAVESCGKSFEGMPLNCTYPDGWFAEGTDLFTNHGTTNIGYIRKVYPQDDNLMAEIVVWKEKFPDEAYMILNGMNALGFSLEWYATATHEQDDVVYMDEFEGCGCAILWQNCAAFSDTFIEKLAAAKEKKVSDVEMTKEEKEALVKEISASVAESMEERLKGIEDTQAELKAAIDKSGDADKAIADMKAAVDKAQAEVDALKEAAEKAAEESQEDAESEDDGKQVQASAEEIPAPKAGQGIVPNPNVGESDKAGKMAEINASAMNPMDKLREITKLRMQG